MAERSSSAEWQRAARGLPSDTTPSPAKHHQRPGYSKKTAQPPSARKSGSTARQGVTITTKYFTLSARPASTKKQGLRLAFGVRAGRSTARNRAKRQARELYRLNRHRLPETKELVITSRGSIDALGRRATRDQLMQLFERTAAAFPPLRDGSAPSA